MPRYENQVKFDPEVKKKLFSTTTSKPNQCGFTTPKLNHFWQLTQQPTRFHSKLEPSQVRSPTLNSSQFGPPTTTESISSPHWKHVIFVNPHKPSQSSSFLKTSDFRPTYKQQVNFYHPHNKQINFIPKLKLSQVRSQHWWYQVNFDRLKKKQGQFPCSH